MLRLRSSRLWLTTACLLVLLLGSLRSQETTFEEPLPEQTVDPVISPFVWRGGTVVMRVWVDATGAVTRIEVLEPFPALTDPVVAAVRQWRFKPARLGGRPVAASTTVAMHVAIIRTVVPR